VILVAQVALAAQEIGKSNSCGFLLLPDPNFSISSHQKFFDAFGFILTWHLVKNHDFKKVM
jgi:hypothetical protein